MKKRLLARIGIILLTLVCAWSASFAQDRTVTGKVTDSRDGSPLLGASVVPKGSPSKGTVTGADGSFRLTVPVGTRSLVISSVGFGTQQVDITGGALEVRMVGSSSGLNEVVVIGYGSVKRSDLTGSVATVGEKDFQKGGAITTPEQMIAGKIAGVSVISNNGQPGSGSTIRIRGGSSLSASNDPLVVIDGVPVSNDNISGAGSPLSFIDPNDIETFTVLKDASATAIYGTRGSNGVILITTKKGQGGPLRVNLSSVSSVGTRTGQIPVLNAAQFRAIVQQYGTAAQIAMLGGASTNWQDQIFQPAIGLNNTVNLTGGISGLPYRLSLGYEDANGILKTDYMSRTSVALNLNPRFFGNKLKIDLSVRGSMEHTRFATQGAIGGAATFDPTQPVYSKSPRFGGYYEWLDPTAPTGLQNLAGRNPLGQLEQRYDKSSPERSIGSLQVDYELPWVEGLHVNVNLGYDGSLGKGNTYVTDSAASNYVVGGTGGQNNPYKQKVWNTTFESYVSYVRDFKALKSHLDVRGGYSFQDYLTTVYNYAQFYADGSKVANSDPAFAINKPEHTLLSYFGRLIYNVEDKYLLTGTLRRDASSRFGPLHKYGLFPSIAFAWRMKDESFLSNVPAVSDLKLRLGYGITGQQDGIANYGFDAVYALSQQNASYQFGNTYYQGWRPNGYNPGIQWEQTVTSNLGLDYGFADNRISGSIDVYSRKTESLLNNVPQSAGSNFTAFFVVNVGDVTNKGVEFNLNLQPIRRAGLTWDVNFNITYNQDKITKLTPIAGDTNYKGLPVGNIAGGIGGQFAFLDQVGYPKNTFYLFQQVYDKTTGKPLEGVFVDQNGDGIINQADQYYGKSADPKVFLGFSTNLTWNKWNAGFVLRGSFGNYVYNNIASQTGTLNQILGNSVLYNTTTNYLATGFKGGNGQQLLSDYYLQNGSFLRMDNLHLGYNWGHLGHSSVTLAAVATVQNVFVITRYTGLDPELGNGGNPGIDNNPYPRPRTYSLGLNLGF
ncbi:MAG: SusC/RagA family TonB-linked outer membrane protein [Bacteroidota bacterium]|nr:SusC/RagA family TonB-linked outer membrane protein [Bacteroidota bacterium]MDP4253930.1 SusC/RagA family TonB-linked outer membrane protein [Bacteroidota bacterium]